MFIQAMRHADIATYVVGIWEESEPQQSLLKLSETSQVFITHLKLCFIV